MECIALDQHFLSTDRRYCKSQIEQARISQYHHEQPSQRNFKGHESNSFNWEILPSIHSDAASSCSSGTASDYEAITSVSPPESPVPPRVYKPCFVCGDKSSGYHYGVASCEGCKGFFRRSVQKNVQYSCQRDKRCAINKLTRSRCQFCRFKKCIAAGMLRESVRNDRRKRRGKEKQTRMSEATGFLAPVSIPPHVEELLRYMSEAHSSTSPSLTTIQKFRPNFDPGTMQLGSLNMDLWSKFSDRSTKCIIKIVDFAKHIPGFTDCTIADQITLIKSASLDVLVLRLCSRFQPDEDTMTFSDGLTLDRSQMKNCGFGPITEAVYNFAKNLQPLKLDEAEISLLCAICIICCDRPDLEEPGRVEKIQEPLIEALRLHSRRRRPQQPEIFPKLLMKVADLRTISLRGSERAASINMEIPSGTMPPLISEMLLRGNY